MLMAIFSRVSVLLTVLLLLTACAGLETDPTKDWTAERFYTEGKTELKQSNYETAIKHFETLEARYPYGPYAEQAQLEVAYAYYKDAEMASAMSHTASSLALRRASESFPLAPGSQSTKYFRPRGDPS